MAYWLIKSEPGVFSWDDEVKSGPKGEAWTGVRNHQAKLNLMKMKKGDCAFFYHSNEGKEIVGVVEVVREHYPDPTAKAVEPLQKPVTLAEAKAEPRLKAMALVTNTRLSVQPVTADEWKTVCEMGGL